MRFILRLDQKSSVD